MKEPISLSHSDVKGWRVNTDKLILINFATLRMIVMALYNQGSFMKRGLTFSHGNVGNEYQDVSRVLDSLVTELEPRDSVAIIPEDLLREIKEDRENLQDKVRADNQFLEELKVQLFGKAYIGANRLILHHVEIS